MNSPININYQGIDTIGLISRYSGTMTMIKKLGLEVFTPKRKRYNKTFQKIEHELKKDIKIRYSSDKWIPTIEVIKLPRRGNNKSFLMVIVRNTPLLFDLATHHKRPKDTFCMILFTGLHQPSNHINNESIKIMSKLLKRKTFKLQRLDMAVDTNNKTPIDYSYKEVFKKRLKPFSMLGVIKPPNGATSLYINEIKHKSINRILYYDKYLKQTKTHRQNNIPKNWKRLEITLTFEVTQERAFNFSQYVESIKFQEDLTEIKEVFNKSKIREYSNLFLNYQLNSFLDNRFLNNKASKQRVNSLQAIELFNQSESQFKRIYA